MTEQAAGSLEQVVADQRSFVQAVADRRVQRMAMVDDLPEDWRGLVHEYGLTTVVALLGCGVSKPRRAKHIIETILNETSPFRGSYSNQGQRTEHLALIPRLPTDAMIAASMATVSGFDLKITKHEKHRLRLKAALDAAVGAKR